MTAVTLEGNVHACHSLRNLSVAPVVLPSFPPDFNVVRCIGSIAMAYANEFTITCHTASINSLSFTPDGRHLASGGDDGALVVHNCENGTESYKVKYDSPVNHRSQLRQRH